MQAENGKNFGRGVPEKYCFYLDCALDFCAQTQYLN